MRKGVFFCGLLWLLLLLAGCGNSDSVSEMQQHSAAAVSPAAQTDTDEENEQEEAASDGENLAALFSTRDFEVDYDGNESALIRLTGESASCSSDAVQISGGMVTILDEGTYILSGTLDDGMVVVDAEKTDKLQLVLDGARIHSESCAPIYILQSDKVFITTAPGTTNTLSNGGVFTAIDENSIDAVIFSREDLTLNGSGTLQITSPVGHGIVSKDALTVTGGSYDIGCASHGLAGKDEVSIAGGDFTITAGKDGIHAENADDAAAGAVSILNGTFDITAEGDGISAAACLQITDGTFAITAGGGSENAASETSDAWGSFGGGNRGSGHGGPGAMPGQPGADIGTIPGQSAAETGETEQDSTSLKGLKAAMSLTIHGGSFAIDTADDALHANESMTIHGGVFEIASGDDALHADDTLTVNDGTIHITESYEGLEGLHVIVSGGEITLCAGDDGLNAAGGTDASGMTGGRDGMFGGPGMSAASNGSITITGGTLDITAYGDGLDANGAIDITGGSTRVSGPGQGDTATLDYDSYASITGGSFIGTGGAGMAQTFSRSEQGVLAVSVGSQAESTTVTITDGNGNPVLTHTPALSFGVVIFSSPEIVCGESYTVTVGTVSGEVTAV